MNRLNTLTTALLVLGASNVSLAAGSTPAIPFADSSEPGGPAQVQPALARPPLPFAASEQVAGEPEVVPAPSDTTIDHVVDEPRA